MVLGRGDRPELRPRLGASGPGGGALRPWWSRWGRHGWWLLWVLMVISWDLMDLMGSKPISHRDFV